MQHQCFAFPVADVRRANDRATELARVYWAQIPDDLTLDPTPVLASFACLSVKPGWKLRAYLSGGPNNESRVVALPEDYVAAADELRFPFGYLASDNDPPYAESLFDDYVEVPLESRLRFMTVVEGDGSPWSYLCASLAVRQLLDFAALWHALGAHDWRQHRVVACWPQVLPSPWRGEEDAAFKVERPRVILGPGVVTVRVYTYCPPATHLEGVWLHEDHYATGSYDPVLTRTLVATGRPPSKGRP